MRCNFKKLLDLLTRRTAFGPSREIRGGTEDDERLAVGETDLRYRGRFHVGGQGAEILEQLLAFLPAVDKSIAGDANAPDNERGTPLPDRLQTDRIDRNSVQSREHGTVGRERSHFDNAVGVGAVRIQRIVHETVRADIPIVMLNPGIGRDNIADMDGTVDASGDPGKENRLRVIGIDQGLGGHGGVGHADPGLGEDDLFAGDGSELNLFSEFVIGAGDFHHLGQQFPFGIESVHDKISVGGGGDFGRLTPGDDDLEDDYQEDDAGYFSFMHSRSCGNRLFGGSARLSKSLLGLFFCIY